MQERTILVAGGAGFIGSHVNKMLHRFGYQTVVLDNLSRGVRETVCYGTFIEGSIGDPHVLDYIFKNYAIHAVMHFAAYIDVGESVRDPIKYYMNNVVNTLTLLRAMLKYEVRNFIFSSSAAIYGNPLEKHVSEEHPCHPINPYGETKWVVEKMLRDFEAAYGLKSLCLRYFNAAGGDPEGEIKNFQTQPNNLIPIVLRHIKTGQGTLTIFGTDYPTRDGTCLRDYIHIEDLGTAHIVGMEKLFAGAPSSFYNLGNGHGFSVREVIRAAEKVTGKRVHAVEGARRPGDPPVLVANADKAQRELGWTPQYPNLEDIIHHAWNALEG